MPSGRQPDIVSPHARNRDLGHKAHVKAQSGPLCLIEPIIVLQSMFLDSIHRATASLAAIGWEIRAAVTPKGTKALRLTRIQVRRSRRSLRKLARRARVTALMRLFLAQQVTARLSRQVFAHVVRWSATIVTP